MSTYSGTPVVVAKPAAEVFGRFRDLSFFEEKLRSLPAEQLSKIGDVNFTSDSITINTPQMGAMTFEVVERVEPVKVVFGAKGAPVPINMTINFKELAPDSTEVTPSIDVELPAMLRPFVGPKLQEAANKFGQMITNLAQ